MDPTVVPPLSHRDLQPELDRKRSSSSTVRKDSRIVSEYREDTWYSDKDSLDLVVGLSIDSLVAGRRVSSRRLSWARSRDLLGYRRGLCSSALHLGPSTRAVAFLHCKEEWSTNCQNHSLLLWWSLGDERGAEGCGSRGSHGTRGTIDRLRHCWSATCALVCEEGGFCAGSDQRNPRLQRRDQCSLGCVQSCPSVSS